MSSCRPCSLPVDGSPSAQRAVEWIARTLAPAGSPRAPRQRAAAGGRLGSGQPPRRRATSCQWQAAASAALLDPAAKQLLASGVTVTTHALVGDVATVHRRPRARPAVRRHRHGHPRTGRSSRRLLLGSVARQGDPPRRPAGHADQVTPVAAGHPPRRALRRPVDAHRPSRPSRRPRGHRRRQRRHGRRNRAAAARPGDAAAGRRGRARGAGARPLLGGGARGPASSASCSSPTNGATGGTARCGGSSRCTSRARRAASGCSARCTPICATRRSRPAPAGLRLYVDEIEQPRAGRLRRARHARRPLPRVRGHVRGACQAGVIRVAGRSVAVPGTDGTAFVPSMECLVGIASAGHVPN